MYPASGTATIEDVLKDLKSQGRSGVVIENGDDYRLIYLGDLLQAKTAGVTHLQQIATGEKVLLLNNLDALNFSVDLIRPHKTIDQYTALFEAYKMNLALVGATPKTAMVVTSSEHSAEALMQTGGFACDGDVRHYFPAPNVLPNQDCPRPECKRADGRQPKVLPIV
jgi:hypothetical protein